MAGTATEEAVQGGPAKVAEVVVQVRFVDAQHYEVRTITQYDWRKAGVPEAPEVSWTPMNKFMIRKDYLLSFLTEEQYNRFILADPRFEEVEA